MLINKILLIIINSNINFNYFNYFISINVYYYNLSNYWFYFFNYYFSFIEMILSFQMNINKYNYSNCILKSFKNMMIHILILIQIKKLLLLC